MVLSASIHQGLSNVGFRYGVNGKNGMGSDINRTSKTFWLGRLEGHQTYVEESSWYTEGGVENHGGGFYRWSKRFKELTLKGPHSADQLLISVTARRAFNIKEYNWPAGRIAHLVPA